MANFPSVLNVFTRPTTTDKLNSPSHSGLHNTVSSALGQVEAFLGVVGANSVVGTLSYDVRSPASNGGGHVQVANKGGTGQTTYMKGDILVAQSTSVLTKLAVTVTDGYALVSDSTANVGVKWGLPGNTPTIRVYATTSVLSSTLTWSKPSVLSYIVVECVGGGGAGFNGSGAGDSGGGGGGYAKTIFAASSVASSVVLHIGRGGALQGGGADGLAGGTTYFGETSMVVATGGAGGHTTSGGVGGVGTVGTIRLEGGQGYVLEAGGFGGATLLGVSGGSQSSCIGAGGKNGQVGNDGGIIITEY